MDSDRAASGTDAESMPDEEAAAPAVAAEAEEEGESLGMAQEAENKSAGEEVPGEAVNQADEWQEEDLAEASAAPTQTIDIEISDPPNPLSTPSIYFPDEGTTRVSQINPFRILEIIFAIGAVSFGIAAWLIRRRKS